MTVESSAVIHLNQTITCSSSVLASSYRDTHTHTHSQAPHARSFQALLYEQELLTNRCTQSTRSSVRNHLDYNCTSSSSVVFPQQLWPLEYTERADTPATSQPEPTVSYLFPSNGHKQKGWARNTTSGSSPQVTNPNSPLRPVTH